ncbi:hypothetical protein [Novosphingobium sp. Gsoil 351]|uniref:hypothetical protein n=1 Tax=Novosphingobium sp. Gsoil 351 TaxID=2675225 RepID=UPI0012B4EE83|nr:hypothetical protein [Novosphingobium sp. Gsoil 351]QGN53183.1 hypothetical protein GKE62_00005 [Novosphingobium sp. Gsoil 351]
MTAVLARRGLAALEPRWSRRHATINVVFAGPGRGLASLFVIRRASVPSPARARAAPMGARRTLQTGRAEAAIERSPADAGPRDAAGNPGWRLPSASAPSARWILIETAAISATARPQRRQRR